MDSWADGWMAITPVSVPSYVLFLLKILSSINEIGIMSNLELCLILIIGIMSNFSHFS